MPLIPEDLKENNKFIYRFAAKQGHDSLVELLIDNGAQLDAVESQNWTALAFAVDAEKGHVARRLLEAGANPDIATLDGPLPIDMADAKLAFLFKFISYLLDFN